MVALALLVTCINVANLVLVRASGRAKELALRSALGAGRFRIVRQLLTESLMLAALGGIGGGAVGAMLARLATSIRMPGGLPFYFEFDFDWRVFLCTGGIVAVCTVLVGLLPALRATRLDLNTTLREGGRAESGGGVRHRLRHALVVLQVAGSIVVLIAAGLFVRSLQVAQKMNLGFRPQGLLNLTFNPGLMGYDSARTSAFYRALKERVGALPEVESASFASSVPLGFDSETAKVWKEGQSITERPADDGFNRVDEDFFRTMKVPIVEGRSFTTQDSKDSTLVAIVNQEMAARLWPAQNALGQHFRYGEDARTVEVVGVTANGKYAWLFEAQVPFFYVPSAQTAYHSVAILQVRASVPPLNLAPAIESAARDIDPNVPPFAVTTMEESLGGPNGFFLIRTGALFAGFLGALCLLLAVIGVYGVISYAAGQRTHEIGVRMALGAQRRNVLRMVLRQGLVLVSIGLAIGLGASIAVTRFMGGLLFQIGAMDPVTFVGVSVLLVSVAMVACYLPARRATKVDPLIALRYE
jgi:predicted permease